MSDYAQQAEAEMWDAIAAQPVPEYRRCVFCDRPAIDGDDICATHYEDVKRSRVSAAVDAYADECEGGQLGLAVPGEQRSLLPRPLAAPERCAAHDRYHDCPAEPRPMSRLELDTLTVVRGAGGDVELRNSAGLVGTFVDRDAAYAEVRRLRGIG
jgi:hypothetical protein